MGDAETVSKHVCVCEGPAVELLYADLEFSYHNDIRSVQID